MIDLIVRLIMLHIDKNWHKDCGIPDCVLCRHAKFLFSNYSHPPAYPPLEEMTHKIEKQQIVFANLSSLALQKKMKDNVKAVRKYYGKNLSKTIYITVNILLELGVDFPQAIDLAYQNWFVLSVDWQIENDIF